MADNVVFWLKAFPAKVDWPPGTKNIVLDPPEKCGGADPLCSTAYSSMYASFKDASGRVLPRLLKHYGVEGYRPSFVSFSAGHGFMNPFLLNAQDRADTRAVILMDSTFGGGKSGYVAAAMDAAAGRLLLVSVTSDKGSTDALNNGDFAFRKFVLEPAGLISMPQTSAVPPMPKPSEGVFKQGNLWYYRYSDAEAHHWELGKLMKPVAEAHLAPFLSVSGGAVPKSTGAKSLLPVLAAVAAVAAVIAAWAARSKT
jgi:hypothetical protein